MRSESPPHSRRNLPSPGCPTLVFCRQPSANSGGKRSAR